jgi:hypothetical protein
MKYSILRTAVLGAVLAAGSLAAQLDKRYMVERGGVNYTVFEHAATGAKIEYVTNSGICETTAGVNQYSGYLSVGSDMNMCMKTHDINHNLPI